MAALVGMVSDAIQGSWEQSKVAEGNQSLGCAFGLHQAWKFVNATMSYSRRKVITKAFAKAQGKEAEAEITRAFSRSSKSMVSGCQLRL
eukprot:1156724-Pelagomonas_calceolata.AAC.4